MRTWKQGVIGKLTFPNSEVVYLKCLKFPLVAFYKSFDTVSNILSGFLFEIWVHKSVLKSVERVAFSHLSRQEIQEREFFKIDPLTMELSIYSNDRERPATIEEAMRLECAAVWELPHIQERYSSETSGNVSKFKKSMEKGVFG